MFCQSRNLSDLSNLIISHGVVLGSTFLPVVHCMNTGVLLSRLVLAKALRAKYSSGHNYLLRKAPLFGMDKAAAMMEMTAGLQLTEDDEYSHEHWVVHCPSLLVGGTSNGERGVWLDNFRSRNAEVAHKIPHIVADCADFRGCYMTLIAEEHSKTIPLLG